MDSIGLRPPRAVSVALAAIGLATGCALTTQAEVGAAKQPDPLGYPLSVGDEADARGRESTWTAPKRAD